MWARDKHGVRCVRACVRVCMCVLWQTGLGSAMRAPNSPRPTPHTQPVPSARALPRERTLVLKPSTRQSSSLMAARIL
jgi:hypothetical protein